MTHQPFVYGLFDPAEAGHIRYVGMAPSNPSRPFAHALRARNDVTEDSHLLRWIRKIQAEGREPSVMILEQLPNCSGREFLGFVESCYVKSLREIGHKLTNENDGGWGGSNGPHTEEARARMKAGWTPEVRARVGAASRERMLGKKLSTETREKQSKARRRREITEQQKIRVSISRKAAWDSATPEERAAHAAHVSAGRKGKALGNQNAAGRFWSDEQRIARSASLKGNQRSLGFRHSEEAKAQHSKVLSDSWSKATPERRAAHSQAMKDAWAKRKAEESLLTPEEKIERLRATHEAKIARLKKEQSQP